MTMQKLSPRHPVPRAAIVDREGYILEKCQGRNVLHIGCANWPFTPDLARENSLLHQKLESVCSELAGIDISDEGVAYLKAQGYDNIFAADASDPESVVSRLKWTPEIIVAGEIVEHLDAPGPLLRAYAEQMHPLSNLIITVPNAFFIKGFLHMLLGREKVHSDHVAYYSYVTMSELLRRCNFDVIDTKYYDDPGDNFLEKFLDILLFPLLKLRPYLSTGIIFCVQPRHETARSKNDQPSPT